MATVVERWCRGRGCRLCRPQQGRAHLACRQSWAHTVRKMTGLQTVRSGERQIRQQMPAQPVMGPLPKNGQLLGDPAVWHRNYRSLLSEHARHLSSTWPDPQSRSGIPAAGSFHDVTKPLPRHLGDHRVTTASRSVTIASIDRQTRFRLDRVSGSRRNDPRPVIDGHLPRLARSAAAGFDPQPPPTVRRSIRYNLAVPSRGA